MKAPWPLRWALWPATLAHELTHALTAVILGCEVQGIELTGSPHVRYSAPDGGLVVPAAVNIAPLVCGALVALWAVWSGAESDLAAVSPLAWGVATLWWVQYAIPSRDDLRPLLLLMQRDRRAA